MDTRLARTDASNAVEHLGWRYLLGSLRTSVPVSSLAEAAEVVTTAVSTCGEHADGHLRADVRADRVVLTLHTLAVADVTGRDVELAGLISTAVDGRTVPEIGSGAPHSVQTVEIAIDAMDIAAVRPFWKALFGYGDEVGRDGPEDALVDPVGQGPAIWFQQMDRPRPQRNRVHFDVCVPHDEAQRRIEAALAAGGTLLYTDEAPAFWVLADAEGNEACVTTWQGRED